MCCNPSIRSGKYELHDYIDTDPVLISVMQSLTGHCLPVRLCAFCLIHNPHMMHMVDIPLQLLDEADNFTLSILDRMKNRGIFMLSIR